MKSCKLHLKMSSIWVLAALAALALELASPAIGRAGVDGAENGTVINDTQGGVDAAALAAIRVFSFNDLGMHCYDPDFSVFSILPLFNNLHAQVVQVGSTPTILDRASARITYKAQRDPAGSINRTSRGKTNFWKYMQPLFGVSKPVDVGLLNARMPGLSNTARLFQGYKADTSWFYVDGIPITVWDDAKNKNPFPLMSVRATGTGKRPYALPTVVPVSDEMACGACHATGQEAAKDPGIPWSTDPNPIRQYKKNILLLHDQENGTSLYNSRPVLCADCHYSLALDLKGTGPNAEQQDQPFMSRAIHGFHAPKIPQNVTGTCYYCHPGSQTKCLRGVMSQAGIFCANCHGNMYAIAKESRTPWVTEPMCQSCHTGDAVSHLGASIRLKKTYSNSPRIATFRVATNKRFAENPNTLYRNSVGHPGTNGNPATPGMDCEACHGSTHAEWPSREVNDNLAAKKLQGHDGPIIECVVCHGSGLKRTTDGPHGLHNVNDPKWYDGGHEDFAENSNSCQACHGTGQEQKLPGTVLSRAAADRTFTVEGQTKHVAKGQEIGCTLCHD